MAGQAGWYKAPGEDGLLRYWNGTAWTEHRQPSPAAEPVAVQPPAVEIAPADPTPVVSVIPLLNTSVASAPQPTGPQSTLPQSSVLENVFPAQVAAEPVATEPVAAESVAVEPVSFEPTFTEPTFTEPTFTEAPLAAATSTEPMSRAEAALAELLEGSSNPAAVPDLPIAAAEPVADLSQTTAPLPDESATPAEPDWSMDQFEKQFEQSNDSVLAFEPNFDSDADPLSGAASDLSAPPVEPAQAAVAPTPGPAPQNDVSRWAPQGGGTTALQSAPTAPAPHTTELAPASAALTTPVALAPAPSALPATPATDLSTALQDAPAPTLVAPELAEQGEATTTYVAPPGGAIQAIDGLGPVTPRRKSVRGAALGILVGVLVILIGIGAMAFLGQSAPLAAGQIKTVGIVTSLGTKSASCVPIAQFAGSGGSYTATTSVAVSPCPFQLGQGVDVVYRKASPATTGHIVVPNPLAQYAWLVPAVGGILFLASLFTFIVRAGSIAAGITMLREGDGRRRRDAAPQGR